MQKHVILVVGTHRSGTSLVNRLLNIHGVCLPTGSDYKNEFNVRGYWESFEVQKINDEILKLGDSSWFDVRPFSLAKQSADVIEKLEKDVIEFCERLLAQDAEIFSIKDPRVCRLVPIWRKALEGIGATVSAIIPYRHPLEVAASLKHRDGFDTNYCLSIWLRNFLDAEFATRNLDRAFCSYTDIFSDWPSQFSNISQKLGLTSLRPFSDVEKQVDDFISRPLKHWSHNDSELADYVGPDGLVNRTYQLLKLVGLDDNETIHAGLDGIREKFDESRLDTDELRTRTKDETRIKSLRESLQNIGLDLEQQKSNVKNLKRSSANARQQIENLKSQNRELTENIDGLTNLLEETKKSESSLKSELHALNFDIQNKNTELESLSERLASTEGAYEQKLQEFEDLGAHHHNLDTQFQKLHTHYKHVLGSFSWKITWPYRVLLKYLITLPVAAVAAWFSKINRSTVSPFEGDRKSIEPLALTKKESDSRVYVPITTEPPPKELAVRLIAFYLPQFHPIPENDRWWGKGFTEWTNVRPAKPQFTGHYQPRIPGELGYYDLRDVETQKRQVELAQLYGVGGFCFYFYWFKGQRLLEAPLLQYLENIEFQLPFCVCWANESWSRTWDGLENDILIGQEHSDADDLAFIAYVSKYFKNDRYIRVDGKPLLIVYRPNLFPDALSTSVRWRDWCESNGIGEIFIAYPQSFEAVDPAKYGFDAAIEFPPNNSHPEIVTDNVTTRSDNFSGIIYDWTSIAARSRRYSKPDYPLFRTVNPSWDNTARRRNAGSMFIGSTPEAYGEWLENAAQDTVERFSSPSERLTFVNAWNEWAEGAYLEPDREYGYAYLQATRNALEKVPKGTAHNPCGLPRRRVSAIVPNYNYARHLKQRLASIFSQTYSLFEIIVLDDASTDNSVELIEELLAKESTDCQLIINDENSGSVFKQWQKGVQLARGDFIWICEADDFSDPTFLEETIKLFDHDDVVLGYSQSKQIDDSGNLIKNDYLDYTNDICAKKWKRDYVNDGTEELAHVLAVKNSIPNVSAVVFRKSILEATLIRCIDDMLKLTIAGDWLIYSDLLQQGSVGFISRPLNNHRRHEESVTHDSSNNEKHMAEILYMHNRINTSVRLDAETREKAFRFEEHAFTYLNLGNSDENPRKHAAVSDRLRKLSQ